MKDVDLKDPEEPDLLEISLGERLTMLYQDEKDDLFYAKVSDKRGSYNTAIVYHCFINLETEDYTLRYTRLRDLSGLTRSRWYKRLQSELENKSQSLIQEMEELGYAHLGYVGWEMRNDKVTELKPGTLVIKPDGSYYYVGNDDAVD